MEPHSFSCSPPTLTRISSTTQSLFQQTQTFQQTQSIFQQTQTFQQTHSTFQQTQSSTKQTTTNPIRKRFSHRDHIAPATKRHFSDALAHRLGLLALDNDATDKGESTKQSDNMQNDETQPKFDHESFSIPRNDHSDSDDAQDRNQDYYDPFRHQQQRRQHQDLDLDLDRNQHCPPFILRPLTRRIIRQFLSRSSRLHLPVEHDKALVQYQSVTDFVRDVYWKEEEKWAENEKLFDILKGGDGRDFDIPPLKPSNKIWLLDDDEDNVEMDK